MSNSQVNYLDDLTKQIYARNAINARALETNIFNKPTTWLGSALGGLYGYNYTEEDAPLGGRWMGAARGAASGLGISAIGSYAGSKLSNSIIKNSIKSKQQLNQLQSSTDNLVNSVYKQNSSDMVNFSNNRYNSLVNFSNIQQVINRGTVNPDSSDDYRMYKELAGSNPKLAKRQFTGKGDRLSQVRSYLRGKYNTVSDATPNSLGLVKNGNFPMSKSY